MKQEDKELILRDLCARLPYGVNVEIKLPNHEEKIFESQIGELREISKTGGYLVSSKGIDYRSFLLDIKPYLRPRSSMTKEEIEKYHETCEINDEDFTGEIIYFPTIESWDYLNSIHSNRKRISFRSARRNVRYLNINNYDYINDIKRFRLAVFYGSLGVEPYCGCTCDFVLGEN